MSDIRNTVIESNQQATDEITKITYDEYVKHVKKTETQTRLYSFDKLWILKNDNAIEIKMNDILNDIVLTRNISDIIIDIIDTSGTNMFVTLFKSLIDTTKCVIKFKSHDNPYVKNFEFGESIIDACYPYSKIVVPVHDYIIEI